MLNGLFLNKVAFKEVYQITPPLFSGVIMDTSIFSPNHLTVSQMPKTCVSSIREMSTRQNLCEAIQTGYKNFPGHFVLYKSVPNYVALPY